MLLQPVVYRGPTAVSPITRRSPADISRTNSRSARIWRSVVISLVAGTASAQAPTNIFDPAGTPARTAFFLSLLVLSVTLAIFLIVGGLLLYAVIRLRHRP